MAACVAQLPVQPHEPRRCPTVSPDRLEVSEQRYPNPRNAVTRCIGKKKTAEHVPDPHSSEALHGRFISVIGAVVKSGIHKLNSDINQTILNHIKSYVIIFQMSSNLELYENKLHKFDTYPQARSKELLRSSRPYYPPPPQVDGAHRTPRLGHASLHLLCLR